LAIVFCGLLSGGEDFEEFYAAAMDRKKWFATFLELKNRIPSGDTLAQVMGLVGP
jgi:hypothetical protein